MDKVTTVKGLLRVLGMPLRQQADICALSLLAKAELREGDPLRKATNEWKRIHDIIAFINANYPPAHYAENSRETFRKQAMHHFRTAAIIEDNGVATNSPNFRYRITPEFLSVLRSWTVTAVDDSTAPVPSTRSLRHFLANHQKLCDIYSSKRRMEKIPVRINGCDFTLSPGDHNRLQRAIIEEFAPRFAPGAECLYLGDTTQKDLVKDTRRLSSIGFEISTHDKMPDVILFRQDTDWLYFIEAVDSVGPMSPARVRDLEAMTSLVSSGKIYVTAFLTFEKYRRFASQLAWETEVWIAEVPDHMIHLNGHKFIGPR